MNIEKPQAEQKLSINWRMETRPDDYADRPDEMQDGFWPSLDPESAGYVLPEYFDSVMSDAKSRMAAYESGHWYYVGVIAHATIDIPIGGGSFRILEVESAGAWGVESDSGDEYLADLYADQRADLTGELEALARAILESPLC